MQYIYTHRNKTLRCEYAYNNHFQYEICIKCKIVLYYSKQTQSRLARSLISDLIKIYGPRHANLVLIAYASSEGSGETAHPRSLARTSLLAHTSSESRGPFRQKARSVAPLNGWECAVKICHDRMLEDTNSLDGAHMNAQVKRESDIQSVHWVVFITLYMY